ncbi:sugar ABC transporter substrate-binding protein [Eleftheria terrae]|uniref:sugar ABC transporter substrate-binding protein n=1 Tax=Eleftheria terrae TaxID=1597781 RepID=UPI00263B4C89|nr:sugar ABC transporter substrate-binding protein [Eleftheria terrae]WKB51286.1 sugar ABC transporter substrate-binding protein [Eleftheria terrae]
MKRWTAALAAALMFPLAALAQTKIGVSMAHFDDNFLTILRQAMAKHAEGQKGVSIHFEDARGDVGRQVNQVETFVSQKVSAIIVNPADTAATKRMSEAARKAGVPIVYVNRRPDEKMGNGAVFVGSDSLIAGRLQMDYLAKKLEGKGNVVIMVGELSTDAARDRTKGVKEVAAKYPGIKIIEEQTANWQRNQGLDLMSKWISAGLKIDAVASNNDEMAIGALLAMRQAKVSPKKVLVAGVDATPDALTEMQKGDLAVTVFQNARAQGVSAVEAAIKLSKGDKSVPAEVMIPYELVTPENFKKYASN